MPTLAPASRSRFLLATILLLVVALLSPATTAQTQTQAQLVRDAYARSDSFGARTENLTLHAIQGAPAWVAGTSKVSYRVSVKGGTEFVVADATTATKAPAFDHVRLAAALSSASGEKYTALALPFQTFTFAAGAQAIDFTIAPAGAPAPATGAGRQGGGPAGQRWHCTLTDYVCARVTASANAGGGRQGGRNGGAGVNQTLNASASPGGPGAATTDEFRVSPDGKWQALIRDYNVYVRESGKTDGAMLSTDGSAGIPYVLGTIAWADDSKKLAAYKVRPGYNRVVHYVESSPADQVQPKYSERSYPKAGDPVDIRYPTVFDVAARKAFIVDTTLFANPYNISNFTWRDDSRAVTFEYNQRGHQAYRVIEVDAATGKARAVVNEETKTYFCYYDKKYRYDVNDGREVIWMSERDGWNQLYLYDGATGQVKNQITKGRWVVRDVDRVDESARQIWFRASGMTPGKDPYLQQTYRINFDGTGLTPLTTADAEHAALVFSPDNTYYVDTYSRVDLPPVSELHRSSDQTLVMELERADISALTTTGWRAPEVFSAMGRDGTTDIWGIIIKPTNFDPSKKYPVIENIYAGPHSAFVPKVFSTQAGMNSLAELGFIVVQIDGMGTSNRSKAFHDVSWKNIKDAGFPDRILWHKAVAAKYAWYDITRGVGIYGTSAGGQNSTGALLFHPEFYKVAVSAAGCHDNRMDKISWNEQFMSWPVGPEYAESSNVDNAYRLQGHLFLYVGEMDTNVDPSSTLQVVNALIKANKEFDLLVQPGANHGNGGAYGTHKRNDYFVHYLLGLEPPAWNTMPAPAKPATSTDIAEEDAWQFGELPAPRHLDKYWD